MTTINAKMGLKPRTRVRQATHGSGLVTSATCPTCECRHVVEHEVHGRPLRLCGACGATWQPADAELAGDVDDAIDATERGAA